MILIRDTDLNGFGIRCSRKGVVAYYTEGRIKELGGSPKKITIGKYPAYPAPQKLVEAKEILRKFSCIELIRSLISVTAVYGYKQEESIHELMLRLVGIDIYCCPQCGKGKLVYLGPVVSLAYDDTKLSVTKNPIQSP